jgi:AAA15 family ATPase/GTPase
MKIAKLTIHNFLRLKDVEMNPSKTNVIVGRNKQGKTSILKAIRTCFDGKADASSIRIGEGKAEITVELDELSIKRTITEKGNYLDISNREGMKMPAPQKYLDGILGTFSFNPIEFFEKKPADRKKYLLNAIKLTITQDELAAYTGEKLTGMDFEGTHALEIVEVARKHYYDQRTVANAEVTKKEKALQDLTSKIPEGFDAKSVSEEEITKLRDAIASDEKQALLAKANTEAIEALQRTEKETVNEIARLTERLKVVQDEIVERTERKFDYSDEMALGAARDTLAKLESQREIVFTVKRAEEVRGELSAAIQEATKLDGVVKKLTKEVPEDLIKKAKLPVEGLTISGDDILIGGISIDNLSSSEQLKFGLQVVRALNGEFKVICVDGIETLDAETFEAFLKEIENDDYQYFVTRVEGNSPHSIVIEDGAIKA